MSSSSLPKLTYFGYIGRGELPRLLFVFSGVAFEDIRVSRPDFAELKLKCPLGQLPTLEVHGVVYAQSMAINRYAAKLGGLYPENPRDALFVDMVSETLCDLYNTTVLVMMRRMDQAVRLEKKAAFLNDTLPNSLVALETMVRGEYFLGDGSSASLADLQLFDLVENLLQPVFPEFDASAYPILTAIIERVKANENVAAYLANESAASPSK